MAVASTFGAIKKSLKDSTSMIKNKAMECTSGLTVASTKAFGKMENSTGLLYIRQFESCRKRKK